MAFHKRHYFSDPCDHDLKNTVVKVVIDSENYTKSLKTFDPIEFAFYKAKNKKKICLNYRKQDTLYDEHNAYALE